MHTAVNKAIQVGRATAVAMGVGVMLALVLGLATVALAAVPGDPFRLGQVNAVNTLTRLTGSTNNAMLRINNGSAGPNATALDLQVAPGKPPMTVNSAVEVQGLNVDSLDGRNSNDFLEEATDRDDFLPDNAYTEVREIFGPGSGNVFSISAFCDPEDIALGGGGSDLTPGTGNEFVATNPHESDPRGWTTRFLDPGNGGRFDVTVRCADFPPLR